MPKPVYVLYLESSSLNGEVLRDAKPLVESGSDSGQALV